jgi:hypothetical protein
METTTTTTTVIVYLHSILSFIAVKTLLHIYACTSVFLEDVIRTVDTCWNNNTTEQDFGT